MTFLMNLWFILSYFLTFQEGRLEVLTTTNRSVFNVSYQADLKWNVELTLLDQNGRKKFFKKIKDTDGFLLPIDLDGESSGLYTIEIFTPAYDLRRSFDYVSWQDELKTSISIDYNQEKRLLRVSSSMETPGASSIFIYNESGDKLIEDDFPANSRLVRSYNLDGAPANRIEVIVSTLSSTILQESFDF